MNRMNSSSEKPMSFSKQDDDDRGRPGERDRAEGAQVGQEAVADAACRQREQLALFDEIGGEEDDEEELRGLDRLEGDRSELDPQLDAVQLFSGVRR